MKVLLVAGASGGHIFPAFGLVSALKKQYRNAEILLLLPKKSKKFNLPIQEYNIRFISTATFSQKGNLKILFFLLDFLRCSWDSLFTVISFKPEVVVGFGTIDSIPAIFFAWFFRIRTLIHEQNVLPGRANKLLAKFVDQVAVSFEQTEEHLDVNKAKITFTGNPLRESIKIIEKKAALDYFSLNGAKFTILVIGGSQGSQRINSVFFEAINKMQGLDRLQVIHICGNNDYELLRKKYLGCALKVSLFSFLDKIEYAYSASDLVITRAGATTVAELLYFDKPAVIIPYPFAYAHQYNNAKVLADMGKAVIINENELEFAKLSTLLEEQINILYKAKRPPVKEDYAQQDNAALKLAQAVASSL